MEAFKFDVVLASGHARRLTANISAHGLVGDVTFLTELEHLPLLQKKEDLYLHVVQKSPLWLHLRAQAIGTASAVGKLLLPPPTHRFPTREQVAAEWQARKDNTPFQKKPCQAMHMQWGNVYEDLAQHHFAWNRKLAVGQVGTIHLSMSDIQSQVALGAILHGDEEQVWWDRASTVAPNACFLVSPDGMVGRTPSHSQHDLPNDLLGMLEIKCASPFNNNPESDGTVGWVADMEKRQWSDARWVSWTYILQLGLQALAGVKRFTFVEDEPTMWFIRWTPNGWSEFTFPFKLLQRMGAISALLYAMVYHRNMKPGRAPMPEYTEHEQPLYTALCTAYQDVIDSVEYRYVSHPNAYPEFQAYRTETLGKSFPPDLV